MKQSGCATERVDAAEEARPLGDAAARTAAGLLNAVTVVLFALHYIHLAADFPNFSRWIDWSKYTDEGWYGDAAIRLFQRGHWYVAGDFNPAVALPVWPLLEALLFRWTGVSPSAIRALTVTVFGGILAASWLLVARSSAMRQMPSIAASGGTLLLAASAFCFVFTRLAILEPLLVFLTLLALLAAQAVDLPEETTDASGPVASLRVLRVNPGALVGLGVLLPLMILTKTTGLFLVPGIFWMLFARLGYRVRPFLRGAVPVLAIAFTIWLLYFLVLVRPHYLLDYRYLFSANAYTRISRANFATVLWNTVKDGRWCGGVMVTAAAVCGLLAAFSWRRLRLYPLLPALLLWALGYSAFLAYHNNLQPRYYFVIAVPLTLLVPVTLRDLVAPRLHSPVMKRVGWAAAGILFAAIAIPDEVQTIGFIRHPQYTFLDAAHRVERFIVRDKARDPGHNPLVLSISGSDLSLMTGLPSICDDFGTLELADRVNLYKPGWYLAWNLIEDDKMDALTPAFHVQRVATFPAMDDPDRNLLVLYRLDEVVAPEPSSASGRTKRRARPKAGQQPSAAQTQH